MASELYRWQAAFGALAGSLVAGALVTESKTTWSPEGVRSVEIAEATLAGSPVPVDLAPEHGVATAIGQAGASAPLLMDMSTVGLFDAVRHGIESTGRAKLIDPLMTKAAEIAWAHRFDDAIEAVGGDEQLAMLVGAFVGLEGGIGAIPARHVASLGAPDGGRGRRYLCGLTNRLLGVENPSWYDPRNRRGPKEVLSGIWVANLFGISRFTKAHPNGLVLSLCNEEGRVDGHPHHITFHIEDTPRTDANPSIDLVIDEVLAEITRARSDSQPVLVHCRQGASRTGLILRLLLIAELGLSPDDAIIEAQCLWPHTSTWNKDWAKLIESRNSVADPSGMSGRSD